MDPSPSPPSLTKPSLTALSLAELALAAQAFNARVIGAEQVRCCHVASDSRRVRVGSLFAARAGQRQDGRHFIEQALQRGAAAVLVSEQDASRVQQELAATPLLVVSDVALALGPLAHAALGNPSEQVAVSGITGTNGKTTSAILFRQSSSLVGRPTASLGTLGFEFAGISEDFGLTTPEADVVAECVARARDAGASDMVMEVSSHALSQHRVNGIHFAAAGYCNLSQDHLDYHGTLEEYARVKATLFEEGRTEVAVLNIDDAAIATLAQRLDVQGHPRLLRVGSSAAADLRLSSVTAHEHGTRFEVNYAGTSYGFSTALVGEHNVSNWLVVLGMLLARGVSLEQCQVVVPHVTAAPGRFERCDASGDDIAVVVDYAHTPDALERALRACRSLCSGRLWCVFGCGGDRDRGKRPRMGAVAARLADRLIITNDNPRTEAPQAIADQVLEGTRDGAARVSVMLDRRAAIEHAVRQAEPRDWVLVAGKGHESYQIFGTVRHDFDDRAVARAALSDRREGLAVSGEA